MVSPTLVINHFFIQFNLQVAWPVEKLNCKISIPSNTTPRKSNSVTDCDPISSWMNPHAPASP